MRTNEFSEDRFDEMLGRALRRHSEDVPADFTAKMLRQVRDLEEQRILARVAMQARLALAGSIAAGAAAIVAVLVFPGEVGALLRGIGAGFAERGWNLVDGVPQTLEVVRGQWQFYGVLAVLLGLAIVSFVDLLLGDRFKMA